MQRSDSYLSKIFISYSHTDESFCDMLQKHLSALQHQGLIETWHDRRINAGDEFDNAIDQNLNDAEIILLLVISDFIASRYCYDIEMKHALQMHASGKARVIPVILRPCDWHDTPFGKLLAAPKDGKPVKSWPDIDEAFLDVVQKIKAVLPRQKKTTTEQAISPNPGDKQQNQVVSYARSANLTIRKAFSEADKDDFLERSYIYVASFFENSLRELENRNPQLSTRFRRIDANHFTAVVYKSGETVSRCKVSLGGMFGRSIGFSNNDQSNDNSFNESLSVEADDQHLFLRALGLSMSFGDRERKLTEEGAAELYWSLLLSPLQ